VTTPDPVSTPSTDHDPALRQPPPVSTIPAEARSFQGQRAGIVTRVIANVIDASVVALTLIGIYLTVVAIAFLLDPRGFQFPRLPPWWLIISAALWLLGIYFTLSWAVTGRTYGDHLMGLRVVGPRGSKPHFITACVRAIFCVLFPIGLFWIIASRGSRSLQDVFLRTSVIYDWTARRGS
jgi:uncharacterized RDD family membrane protein YckC